MRIKQDIEIVIITCNISFNTIFLLCLYILSLFNYLFKYIHICYYNFHTVSYYNAYLMINYHYYIFMKCN